jgi:hypothetical protein
METEVADTTPAGGQGQSLKRPLEEEVNGQPVFGEDAPVTTAEKAARGGDMHLLEPPELPSKKRTRLNPPFASPSIDSRDKVKGIAMVKPE